VWHDITEASKLIRPDDEVVYGDAGYLGLDKRPDTMGDAHKSKLITELHSAQGRSAVLSRALPAGIAEWNIRKPQFEPRSSTRYISLKIHLVSARPVTEG
jgi:hypothetical protein